jgi:hypothetical protein
MSVLIPPTTRSLIPYGFDEVNAAAGATNSPMSGLGASTQGDLLPFPFSVVGISAVGNADCTQGSITFEATIDGAGTGLTAVIDTTNVRQKATTQAPGLDTAASGKIGARFTSTANLLPAGSTEYEVFVYVVADISSVS